MQFPCAGFQVSERRECRAFGFNRSSHRYKSVGDSPLQVAIRIRLKDLAAARVRYGYRRLHILLKREGWQLNVKRVYRLYKQEGLSLRLKTRKKRLSALWPAKVEAQAPNEHLSMDVMSDKLANGKRFRVLTLVDRTPAEYLVKWALGEGNWEDGAKPKIGDPRPGPGVGSRAAG